MRKTSFFILIYYLLLYIIYFCILVVFSEEREQPELLAESPARRKRIAQESGKTEQQVEKFLNFVLFHSLLQNITQIRKMVNGYYFCISGEPTCCSAFPNAC